MSRIILTEDEASISLARQHVRELGRSLGLSTELIEQAAVIASELGYNHLHHARLGELEIRAVHRPTGRGLEIAACDGGPGLRDPLSAFRGELRLDGSGLGVGLAGVRRLASELDVATRLNEGTRIIARVLPSTAANHPSVAVVGRPFPGEPRSGDDAAWVRTDDRLVLILADGLGHGPEARHAASLACRCCVEHAALEPHEALATCDATLKGTRGSAVAVAALDLRTDEVTVAIVGNIRAGLYGASGGKRFPYTPRVLGRSQSHTIRATSLPRAARSLVLFTDGISDRIDPSTDRPGVLGWPLPLAARLVDRYGSDRDDVTVIAAR